MSTENDPDDPFKDFPLEPVDLGPIDLELAEKMLDDAIKDLPDLDLDLSSGGDSATTSSPVDTSPVDDSPSTAPVANTGNHTPQEVAEWIYDELQTGDVYVNEVAGRILELFGADFVDETTTGNLTVIRKVITALRKICPDLIYEKEFGEGYWRLPS